MTTNDIDTLLAGLDEPLLDVVQRLREVLGQWLPDAVEEPDLSARLIGFTYQPGTYKGLLVAIQLQRSHVNLMFARGAELLDHDTTGLLEGTGKRARHIKFREPGDVDRDGVRTLVEEASRRTSG